MLQKQNATLTVGSMLEFTCYSLNFRIDATNLVCGRMWYFLKIDLRPSVCVRVHTVSTRVLKFSCQYLGTRTVHGSAITMYSTTAVVLEAV